METRCTATSRNTRHLIVMALSCCNAKFQCIDRTGKIAWEAEDAPESKFYSTLSTVN
jgi:hypothetical protein